MVNSSSVKRNISIQGPAAGAGAATGSERSDEQPTPVRKKIQILKVNASQGTNGQYFETGGSFDHLENLRMSTKLLPNDQKTASPQSKPAKENSEFSITGG